MTDKLQFEDRFTQRRSSQLDGVMHVTFLPVSTCYHRNSKSCRWILMIFFGWVWHVTSNSWLDLAGDPDHDADHKEFLNEFLPLRNLGNADS